MLADHVTAGEFTFETFIRFSSVFHPFFIRFSSVFHPFPTVGCVRPAFQNGGGFHFVGPLIYFYGFSQLIGHATSICKFHMIQIRLAKITHRNRWLSIDASGPSPSILQSNVSMFHYSMFAACLTYSPPGLINRNRLIHSSTPSAQRIFRKEIKTIGPFLSNQNEKGQSKSTRFHLMLLFLSLGLGLKPL